MSIPIANPTQTCHRMKDHMQDTPEPYSASRPKPTDDWCGGCGSQSSDLVAGRCHDCAGTMPGTIRVLASDLAAQTRELERLRAQVTTLQADATRLVEERLALDWTSQVRQLFEVFEQEQPGSPGFPDAATVLLRRQMVREEYDELMLALDERDLVEVTDGCIDLCVVAIGLLVAFGIDPRPIWAEVQRTNVAKRGPGAWKSATGKMMKPPGWAGPDVGALLRSQGFRDEQATGEISR